MFPIVSKNTFKVAIYKNIFYYTSNWDTKFTLNKVNKIAKFNENLK